MNKPHNKRTIHRRAAAAGTARSSGAAPASRATAGNLARHSNASSAAVKSRRGRRPIPLLRERILRSAAELFGEKGFDRVLTEEVAERAGVGKGSVYRQFPSKEELYAAAVIDGFVELRRELEKALGSTKSVQERVTTIARHTLAYFWDRRHFFVLLRDPASLPRRQENLYRKEREQFSLLVSRTLAEGARSGLLRGDLDFQLAAESLLGMMRGIQRYKRENVGLEEALDTVVALFLDGTRHRNAQPDQPRRPSIP